ncbi:MAG: [FeFe] hydrogenase H-cluster radical SAM maturase HydE [Suipraeoptans sp.]
MKSLINKLYTDMFLTKDEWIKLFANQENVDFDYLFSLARKRSYEIYGNKIFIRGLIEFTNYCKNDCYYCGIRRDNSKVSRYRLTTGEILECCKYSYDAGFRTFVLQGGEDPYFTDTRMIDLIQKIRRDYNDCAITLSIGERSHDSYEAMYAAGADRFLLRHETALCEHYSKLHPPELTSDNRKRCLYDLKSIGFQTGTGFMVGSPYQTSENLAEDMMFIKELGPHMVGIGPFISHNETPFKDKPSGTLSQTLYVLALLRLMIPKLLIPSTTALGTLDKDGRLLGIRAGANVIMQNVTPKDSRINYTLYENKDRAGDIDNSDTNPLFIALKDENYKFDISRGDSKVTGGK